MRILLLDPGLASRHGHNLSIAAELADELATRGDARLTIAGSVDLDPTCADGVPARMRPAFRLQGYQRLDARAVSDAATLDRLRRVIDEDLEALDVDDADALLMPTAYPLHLEGLARRATRLRGRLSCGLLMPPAFWDADGMTRAWIGRAMEAAVRRICSEADAFVYTETGGYGFGGQRTALPTALPPVSTKTRSLMARLEAGAPPVGARVRFGFFGSPFTSKGFQHLVALAECGLPEHAELVVRLPDGHEALAARLAAFGPRVDATSRAMSNPDYLAEMAAVDVVLAPYDPREYGAKMSGIVPEAISLGKALLVGEGCEAIVDFLDRHAPGSFAQCGFDPGSIGAAMSIAPAAWGALRGRAAASAALMREMKSARRWLALAGVGLPASPKPLSPPGEPRAGASAAVDGQRLTCTETP